MKKYHLFFFVFLFSGYSFYIFIKHKTQWRRRDDIFSNIAISISVELFSPMATGNAIKKQRKYFILEGYYVPSKIHLHKFHYREKGNSEISCFMYYLRRIFVFFEWRGESPLHSNRNAKHYRISQHCQFSFICNNFLLVCTV